MCSIADGMARSFRNEMTLAPFSPIFHFATICPWGIPEAKSDVRRWRGRDLHARPGGKLGDRQRGAANVMDSRKTEAAFLSRMYRKAQPSFPQQTFRFAALSAGR
jgi:hypothetical protein